MQWNVPPTSKGERLVSFVKGKLGDQHSARKIKLAIEANACRVNGIVERHASTRLQGGEKIDFDLKDSQNKPLEKKTKPKNIPILFEDDYLILYDKPTGVVSDESLGLLVNRLDRPTTGILVVAKSEAVLESMIAQYKEWDVHKTYLALVDGVVEEEEGVVESSLGKLHSYEGQALWGTVPSGGKRAITRWNCLRRGEMATLVACEPVTGRTHQIRVHLSEMGHPVLGDYQYGRKKIRSPYPAKRVLLHAQKLTFTHPVTGEVLTIESPLPQDFQEAVEAVL